MSIGKVSMLIVSVSQGDECSCSCLEEMKRSDGASVLMSAVMRLPYGRVCACGYNNGGGHVRRAVLCSISCPSYFLFFLTSLAVHRKSTFKSHTEKDS